ncbi:helix-turn-helix domain-containing protein [Chryseobacterium sp. CBSDS_008]|uniref:helix-turn-helix domain-containing protein n=1 Tax=Chryseobacterium sp. CBSDS_008 TaxID=3415265 RepID=UPI003CF84403
MANSLLCIIFLFLTHKRKIDPEIGTKSQNTDIAISKETEIKLLERLDQFEKDEAFNNSYISLSYIATEFNTNVRYISYIVKKHKATDFKNYINTLRVNYIIHRLSTYPQYRKYKIGVLAEECGFSSHSKFTTIFKAIAGISPSAFIVSIEQKAIKNNKK